MSPEIKKMAIQAAKITTYVLGVILYVSLWVVIVSLVAMVLPKMSAILGIALAVFHISFIMLYLDSKAFPRRKSYSRY